MDMPEASETPRKVKRVVFFALMILLTLTVSVIVLELGLATYYSEGQSASWSEFHSARGWSLIPGVYRVKPLQRLVSFSIHINDMGLRSHGLPESNGNRERLLVLGDSFTFARETRTEKMFTRLLQDLLEERWPDRVDVMNAGVPGYGTAQQLLLMRELHEKHNISPEMYVLMVFTNDILDNLCLSYGNLAPQPARPCFVLAEKDRPVFDEHPEQQVDSDDDTLVMGQRGGGLRTLWVIKALAEEWLQTKPEVVRFLGRFGVNAQVARIPGLLNGWYRDEIVAEGVPLTGALIRQIQREAHQRGGRLVVSMVPSPFQVYPKSYVPLLQKSFPDNSMVEGFLADMLRPQRSVAEMCLEAGVPFHDLFSLFFENNDKALFVPRDGHLSDAGHRLVAQDLLEFVVTQWPGLQK